MIDYRTAVSRFIPVVLALSLIPCDARAQARTALSAVNRFAGQVVFVERVNREVTPARVVSASDDALVALVFGVDTRFTVSEVRRVYLTGRDPIKNGMWIGAGAGALMGVFACQGGSDKCSIAGATLGSAVIFGALGAWIDHLRSGRQVIYRRP